MTPEKIEILITMGFTRELAMKAWQRAGTLDGAIEDLLKQTDDRSTQSGSPLMLPLTPQTGALVVVDENRGSVGKRGAPNSEDDELKKAIQASLEDSRPAPKRAATGGGGISTEEEDISKAIELSILTTPGPIGVGSINPLRPPIRSSLSQFVGLKNIGNTCYFNSLLQTYFFLQDFLFNVLHYMPPLPTISEGSGGRADLDASASADFTPPQIPANVHNSVKLILELQKLYSNMVMSCRAIQDPTDVMKAVVDDSGKPVEIGYQQDVSEFNGIFLQRLEEGLMMASNGLVSEKGPINVIKELFYGRLKEEIVAMEENEEESSIEKSDEFSQIILDVAHSDLYSSLDEYTRTKIDSYETPRQHKTAAIKNVWFERFPKFLTFQLQRVQYNRERKEAFKLHTKFRFDRLIYMDRYLECNKDKTKEKRIKQQEWMREKSTEEKKLMKYEQYNGTNTSLDNALDLSIHHLSVARESLAGVDVDGAIETLKGQLDITRNQMNHHREEIRKLEDNLGKLYEDMHEAAYELHGVLVHDGQAGSGHYWAFMFDRATRTWHKFNDITVTPVDEATVFRESEGGSLNTSGYCLIYCRVEDRNTSSREMTELTWEQLCKQVFIPLNKHRKEIVQDALKIRTEYSTAGMHSEVSDIDKYLTSIKDIGDKDINDLIQGYDYTAQPDPMDLQVEHISSQSHVPSQGSTHGDPILIPQSPSPPPTEIINPPSDNLTIRISGPDSDSMDTGNS